MERDEERYHGLCDQVFEFPTSQSRHQRSGGLYQEMDIPTWKWEVVSMDFVVGFPRTRRQYDSIWVIVDSLIKLAHFLHIKISYSVEDYSKVYVREIMKFHGVPLSIISDNGAQLTSHFWKSFK